MRDPPRPRHEEAAQRRWLPSSVRGLLLLLICVLVVPVLLVQAWLYRQQYRVREDAELQANLEMARGVAAIFGRYVDDLRQWEAAIGQATLSDPRDSHVGQLARAVRAWPELQSMSWLSPEGQVLESSDPALVGQDWGERPWWRQIRSGKPWVLTEVSRPARMREASCEVVVPTRDGAGTLRGLMVGVMDPNRLGRVIGIRRSGGAAVSLQDSTGWLAFRSPALEPAYADRDWGKQYPRTTGAALRGQEGRAVEYSRYQRGRRIIGAAPVGDTGWVASAGRPEPEAMAPVKAELVKSALLVSLVALAGLLLAALTAQAITAPLRRLRGHVLAFGRGDLEQRTEPAGPSDLAELSGAFNQMATDLQQRQREREQAEEALRARERSLQGLNAQLTGANEGLLAANRQLRESEAALRESRSRLEAEQERWQGVVEGIADEVWVADAQGRMSLINLPAMTAMGLDEFVGKSVYEVLEEVEILHPSGEVRPPEQSPLLRSLRGEIVRGEEIMRRRHTGYTRWRQFSSAPTRDASGAITGAVAIVRDITEQKLLMQEREQLLREADRQRALLEGILRQLPAGVVVVSPSGQVLLTNAQAEELSGGAITRGAEVGRYPGLRGLHPDGRLFRREDWQSVRALVHGEPIPPEEMLLERSDGSRLAVLAGASPVRDGGDEIVAAVVVLYDITGRKQAEAEQERLHEELIRTERARADLAEQLTAEINHRMKNNLTLISGVLEVQALGLPREGLPWHALRDAIARITALSAVHEQLYEARSARVDVRSVLQRIAEADVQALAAEHVALRVEGDPTSIPSKLGSALALIGNELVINALQYGAPKPDGELEVDVRVRREAEGLRLRVWNSGSPVVEELDVSRQRGLGLALAHDVVVRQLKGTLTLRPDGAGTTAEVFVPEQAVREAELVPVGEGQPTPRV